MMTLSEYEILLIEDDSNDILFIQRAFRQANLKNSINIVKNGDDAVAYLSGEGRYASRETYPLPLLILLDLKLPCRSGLEVLEWLRQQDILRRIPVVILTSSKESIDVDRAYDLGVNSYLLKPVKYGELMKIVEAIDIFWLQLNQFPSI